MNQDDTYRVEFDVTLQDFVDVAQREVKRSAAVRRWRRRDFIITTAVIGAAIFIVLGALDPSIPLDLRLGVAAVCMVVFPFLLSRMNRSQSSLRLHELFREQFGDAPIRVAIELRPDVMWVEQANMQIVFDWKDATALDDASDDVEFSFRNGTVVTRGRAFTSAAQRAAFVQQARALMRTHGAAVS